MSAFYSVAALCILLTVWGGVALGSGRVALCLAVAIAAAAAVAISIGEPLAPRVLTVHFVAVAFPCLLGLGATRVFKRRARAGLRFALGSGTGLLALFTTSSYLGIAVSCLWGVCL